jgi:hypothetical protein
MTREQALAAGFLQGRLANLEYNQGFRRFRRKVGTSAQALSRLLVAAGHIPANETRRSVR